MRQNFNIMGLRNLLRALATVELTPAVILGVVLDVLMLPVGLVMLVTKAVCGRPLDALIPHNTSLPPLLLVHGSGANDMQFLPAWLWLRRHFDVYTVDLPTTKDASIRGTLAPVVARRILSICRATGHSRVHVLGHSMGGLVAAAAAAMNPTVVASVVTIGSPWRGVPALDYVTFGTVRHGEMAPGSALLQTLKCPGSVPSLAVCMLGDPQVPWRRALPDSADLHDGLILKNVGHTSVMLSKAMWSSVASWLHCRGLCC